MKKIIIFFGLFLLFSGCTLNRPYTFNYQNIPKLVLKKMTKSEAIQLIGEPDEVQKLEKKEGNFEILKYKYVQRPDKFSAFTGVYDELKVRQLRLEFKNEILNGYLRYSNFSEDSNFFNFSNYQNIKIGSSTKEDVFRIIKEVPRAQACNPTYLDHDLEGTVFNFEGDPELWRWGYSKKSGEETKTTYLKIFFNQEGIVSKIQTLEEK